MVEDIDIRENDILAKSQKLLDILLIDRSKSHHFKTQRNIVWATDNYQALGDGYQEFDEITVDAVSGQNGLIIQPRTKKSKTEQKGRSREKAEVFTPSWLCNEQNNLVDAAWFGRSGIFNTSCDKSWRTIKRDIPFPTRTGKTWKDYVLECRIEVTCGEAPYLVSRYDTITGSPIDLPERIGLLDRKLRVVNENNSTYDDWVEWSLVAFKSIYAFELQGDNLLLARENLLFTFIDNFCYKFEHEPDLGIITEVANIISWNIWQMDGLRAVVPNTCHEDNHQYGGTLFDPPTIVKEMCPGCQQGDIRLHNGIACLIMDWENNAPIDFRSLLI